MWLCIFLDGVGTYLDGYVEKAIQLHLLQIIATGINSNTLQMQSASIKLDLLRYFLICLEGCAMVRYERRRDCLKNSKMAVNW